MRIAIVNDLPIALEALRRTVMQIPGASLAWSAMDGEQAVKHCAADRPDIILMDLIMPNMDGVEATRRIMRETPCPILVVTATVTGNAAKVFEALGAGALDAIDTPNMNSPDGIEKLCRRIQHIKRISKVESATKQSTNTTQADAASGNTSAPLALVGSSTGGPQALCILLKSLPKPLPFAMVIVQHVDADFMPGMVSWLAKETSHDVRLAQSGTPPSIGVVWMAAGPQHLVFDRNGNFASRAVTDDELHHPSVNTLFHSAVLSRLNPGVAALLTGMGQDGAEGLLELRRANWITIAQDQTTSVVWGMPGTAVRIQAASRTLPISLIGSAITAALQPFTKVGS